MIRALLILSLMSLSFSRTAFACSDLFLDHIGGSNNLNSECTQSVCYFTQVGDSCLSVCAPGYASLTPGTCPLGDPNGGVTSTNQECGSYLLTVSSPPDLETVYECEACIHTDSDGEPLRIEEDCEPAANFNNPGSQNTQKLEEDTSANFYQLR